MRVGRGVVRGEGALRVQPPRSELHPLTERAIPDPGGLLPAPTTLLLHSRATRPALKAAHAARVVAGCQLYCTETHSGSSFSNTHSRVSSVMDNSSSVVAE